MLGPALTGVLAPFPIATSVVAPFTLAQHGSTPSIAPLRGLLRGLIGFAAFCFLIAALLLPIGTIPAFAIAFTAAFTVQVIARTPTQFRVQQGGSAPASPAIGPADQVEPPLDDAPTPVRQ
jgi:hypothetical protein